MNELFLPAPQAIMRALRSKSLDQKGLQRATGLGINHVRAYTTRLILLGAIAPVHGQAGKYRLTQIGQAAISAAPLKATSEIFTDESGRFWGSAGAGGLFYAESTGRVLVQKRSPYVNEPNTWGVWGGKIDPDENPVEALRREVEEESGVRRLVDIEPVSVFKDGKFRYHNFLIVVPEEFEPRHSWESSDHVWTDIEDVPQPMHFGLKAALPAYKQVIRQRHRTIAAYALRVAAAYLCSDANDDLVSTFEMLKRSGLEAKNPDQSVAMLSVLKEDIAAGRRKGFSEEDLSLIFQKAMSAHTLRGRDAGRVIPKKFYVVIPIGHEGRDLDKTKDVARGILDGVQGISDTAGIIMQWYGAGRNAVLAMDAKELLKINKLSRIQYDNPQYLVSNGLSALYRVWDKKTDDKWGHRGVVSNLFDYFSRTSSDKSVGKTLKVELNAGMQTIETAVQMMKDGFKTLGEDGIYDALNYLGRFDEGDLNSLAYTATRVKRDFEHFQSYPEQDLVTYLPSALKNFVSDNETLPRRIQNNWLTYESEARESIAYYAETNPEYEQGFNEVIAGLRAFSDGVQQLLTLESKFTEMKDRQSKIYDLTSMIQYQPSTFSDSFGDYLAQHRDEIKTVRGLVERMYKVWTTDPSLDSRLRQRMAEIPIGTLFDLVKGALEGVGRVYKDEGEWLVKDRKLKVPAGSTLYISSELPTEILEKLEKGIELHSIEKSNHKYALVRYEEMGKLIKDLRLDRRYRIIRINDKKMDAAKTAWHVRRSQKP